MGKKSRKVNRQKESSVVTPIAAAAPDNTASSITPPTGATCWICLDGDPDDEGKSIVRDCSCRGDDAGFVHLSCLVSYADTKSRDLLESGKVGSIEPWRECPHCRQHYQRQVAIDMANSFLLFIGENYPGHEVRKFGFSMIAHAIMDMDYGNNPELREKGKRAASQMISAIQELGEDIHNDLMFAYGALAKFSEADKTRDGYEKALHYYEKVRENPKSVGDGITAVLEAAMDRVKSKRDGRKAKPFSEEYLKEIRAHYEKCVREKGKSSTETLQAGMIFVQALNKSGIHVLECERLSNKLAIISRRILGPEHETTRHVEIGLDHCRKRSVGIMTVYGIKEYYALGFDDDDGRVTVHGPISKPRKPHEEEIMSAASEDVILRQGSPVICHGLKNAAHLNGKVGDIRSFDDKTGRYRVHFEEKSLKSVLVKPENIRIAFDLPDEK